MKTIELTEEEIVLLLSVLKNEQAFQRSYMPKEVRTRFQVIQRQRAYEKIDAIETILEKIV